jgi:4-amino-4-deoxy-L-arabinose transferase-like glycosyltransferase
VIPIKQILKYRLSAAAACVLFLLTGASFVSHLGLQNDESLFANAIFKPYAVAYSFRIGHSTLPFMLMSYLGTLKAWIYRPVFGLFGTGTVALRGPMLLAGAASVWLFYLLLRPASGCSICCSGGLPGSVPP